jgi:pyruvate/2-oxoglutarate dehydrogenase complex dihydrolipoamide acyltransferase (E2) component
MPTQVIMPQLGESVVEGTLTKWLKGKGEVVKQYEALLEVNTDKVDTEVPSPATGVLIDILIPEGTTIQAGTVLALIGEVGEISPTSLPGLFPPQTAAALSVTDSPKGAGDIPIAGRHPQVGFISPLVARLAREHAIDLHRVSGSGQNGRITKQDVLAYLEASKDKLPSLSPDAGQAVTVPSDVERNAAVYPPVTFPGDKIISLNPVRRLIAEHMVFSERTAPHVTTVMEADVSRVIAHRQANKDAFSRDGVNLTLTAYFVAASVAALKAYPMVNSSWNEQGIVLHQPINIGMAASLGEAGLIVPVIHHAENLSLHGLARTINDLANRARTRQLKPDEVKGGTFTITNHGVTGSLFATPIINQPQSAILGVGAIQKRPVVITEPSGGDALAIRPMIYLSLTFDHRILDGAMADLFLSEAIKSLNEW